MGLGGSAGLAAVWAGAVGGMSRAIAASDNNPVGVKRFITKFSEGHWD